ncbi:hypothetical protein OS493_009473 [Desmophyllum pertusum]|uniref:Uncharacterized protein n=1 Tax=Desmophyllum pertusum TaxID=174260 RepID=A0A9W9Z350_9CNID|nr:hypothetical protein OS493_009473 [Desmophyllum pertusum]
MGRRFCGSTPKLSFIPDSSIAYVNVGNSNGNSNGNGFGYTNGTGTHAAARRTSLGAQLDTTIRPAKRRKTKRSL